MHYGFDAFHVAQVFELCPLVGFKRHGGGVSVEGGGRGSFGGAGTGGDLRLEGRLVVGLRHRGPWWWLVGHVVVHPLVTPGAKRIHRIIVGKRNHSMMVMMMAIFIAHGSTDLNAQRAEGDCRQKMDRKKSWEDVAKFRCTVSPADTEKKMSIRIHH